MVPGSLILLVHDIGDIFLVLVRGYMDFKYRNKTFEKLLVVITFVTWCHSRLYLYPKYSLYAGVMVSWGVVKSHHPSMQPMKFGNSYMVCMVLILQLLHIYWTFFMG